MRLITEAALSCLDSDVSERVEASEQLVGDELYVRQWLDALHPALGWCEAQLLELNATHALVHFKGCKASSNEWIPHASRRLASLHTHTTRPFSPAPVHTHIHTHVHTQQAEGVVQYRQTLGEDVDVLDSSGVWCRGRIVELDERLLRLHYVGRPEVCSMLAQKARLIGSRRRMIGCRSIRTESRLPARASSLPTSTPSRQRRITRFAHRP